VGYSCLIPIITDSIDPTLSSTFPPALRVLHFFMLNQEQDKIASIKQIIFSINQLTGGWSSLASELHNNRDRQYISTLVAFLDQFYLCLSNLFQLRFKVSSLIYSSGIFSELQKLKYPENDLMYNSLQKIFTTFNRY
jgi:hypothetical protein